MIKTYRHIYKILIFVSMFIVSYPVEAKKLNIVTTFTILQDIAQNIARHSANVTSITKPGAEIHTYEPTPLDIVKAQKADLILYNGLDLEHWIDKFFSNVHNVPIVILTTGINPISITEGDYKGYPNPHAWMSPSNALIYVDNIRDALIQYDPQNKDVYTQNAKEYKNRLIQLDTAFKKRIDQIPIAQRYLVTSEGAFSYLSQHYNFKEEYLWAVNAEQQGTPQQVRKVVETIKQNKIPVIFSESTISSKPAQSIAKETGIHYGGVLYVDSLSEKNGLVPTYIELLNITIGTIIDGFEYANK